MSSQTPFGRRFGGVSLRALAGAALIAATAGAAWADEPAPAAGGDLAALRQELDALRAEQKADMARQAERARKMDDLARRLDAAAGVAPGPATQAMAAAGVAAAAAAPPAAPPPEATSAARDLEPATTDAFEIYGFAQADYVQDFKRVDPNWKDTLRPSRIATFDGEFGDDGQSIIGVRQSRLGVKGVKQVAGKPLNFKFEFDLFGVGVDEGQTTIRPRHIYGEWGALLAGQTNSLFMDIDTFPNVIDYWGPAGMVFLRNPQVRWTFMNDDTWNVALALEKPGDDIDPGQVREIDPDIGDNLQATDEWPDLTGHVRYAGGWGHVQLAGLIRQLGFETLGTPGNEPSDDKFGWGLNLTSNVKFGSRDKLMLGVVYGEGIASYMNDGGTDLAPEGVPGNLEAEAVELVGVNAYYDHYWDDRWSSSIGYSRTQVDNTSFQDPSAFEFGEYASVNLLYTPAADLLAGVEFLYGKRADAGDDSGEDYRLQFSFKYSFSSKDIL